MAESTAPARRAIVDPGSPAAEAFRTLRLALQLRAPAGGSLPVLVTSAEPGAGKSTTVANLALVSALGNAHVLLIDADVRKPVQHEIFGLSRTPGLVEALAGGESLVPYVQAGPGRLEVLTAGSGVARSSDVTSTARMTELLREASGLYDLVLLDTSPILATADVEAMAVRGDVEVLVVVDRASHGRSITKALRRLELIDAKIAGIVLNREGQREVYGY